VTKIITAEDKIDNNNKLLDLKDFNEVFEFVKSSVNSVYEMKRAGLSLMLHGMPTRVGAYHVLGSNVIAINSILLDLVRKHSPSNYEYNSYLFTVLLHEYLHSFGILNENTVRNMSLELCKKFFGEIQAVTVMAEDPLKIFPQIGLVRFDKFESKFELIKNFDNSNQTYIR
jgi:murein L,D-transpeptidase YafK